MSNRFAVWHCYANGQPFGQPSLVEAERPEAIRAGCSMRLHIEPIDPDAWEMLADRQHELHAAAMSDFQR